MPSMYRTRAVPLSSVQDIYPVSSSIFIFLSSFIDSFLFKY